MDTMTTVASHDHTDHDRLSSGLTSETPTSAIVVARRQQVC
jgi:hypothetical protein